MQIVTRQGSLVEVSEEDITAYHVQGNAFFEARRTHAVHPQHLQELERRQRAWNDRFEQPTHHRLTQWEILADLLEDGYGSVICPVCNRVFAADSLDTEETVIDGINRRRFLCPAGHELWMFPDQGEVMGVIGGAEGEWRPRRSIHRADEWRRFNNWLF